MLFRCKIGCLVGKKCFQAAPMLPFRNIRPFMGENAQVSLENAWRKKFFKMIQNMLFRCKIGGLVRKKVFPGRFDASLPRYRAFYG